MYYNALDEYYKINSDFITFSNNNIDNKEIQIKKLIESDNMIVDKVINQHNNQKVKTINQNKTNQNKIIQNKTNQKNKINQDYCKIKKEFDIDNIIIYQYEPLKNREEYQADIGYFSPYYLISNLFNIIPYENTPLNIKKQVCNMLNHEFGTSDLFYNDDYITSNWKYANIFYVVMNKNSLLGTIAIDRKNFYPCISQLCIVPSKRSLGLGKYLIEFANKYIKSMGFDKSRLWCKEELIPYYQKLNWSIENQIDDSNYIMTYDL
jgi:hypothetical protein